MNLGIDARLLHDTTGIGRYTRSLFLSYLHHPRLRQDHLYLFGDKMGEALPCPSDTSLMCPADHIHCQVMPYPRRIVWTNWHLPPQLKRHGIDVYHGVSNFELPVRKMCRYVVTIHDLVPLFFPTLVPWKHLAFFFVFIKRAAHTADIVITDSEHSKRDLVTRLHVPEEKIRVIYLGYDPAPQNAYDQETMRRVLARHGIQKPYLLFVGVIEPKKNLDRLLEAFALLQKERGITRDMSLVLAGGKGWFCEQLEQKVRELQIDQQVIFTGFVPDDDLAILYRQAELFVFPSIYEGFGLPVIEAMASGVPVVTSNISSLPEIAGDAGVLVNPRDPTAIAEGIASVLNDADLRARMRERGTRQAQQFSWQRTAEETYRAYLDASQMGKCA